MIDMAEVLKATRGALAQGRRADLPLLRAMLERDAPHASPDQGYEADELLAALDAATKAGGASG